MSSKQTRLVSNEMTCDICGKTESWTAIEGVTDQGVIRETGWTSFSLESNTHYGISMIDVCSKQCFLTYCERRYNDIKR